MCDLCKKFGIYAQCRCGSEWVRIMPLYSLLMATMDLESWILTVLKCITRTDTDNSASSLHACFYILSEEGSRQKLCLDKLPPAWAPHTAVHQCIYGDFSVLSLSARCCVLATRANPPLGQLSLSLWSINTTGLILFDISQQLVLRD